jgi:hypothetical protein
VIQDHRVRSIKEVRYGTASSLVACLGVIVSVSKVSRPILRRAPNVPFPVRIWPDESG